MGGIPEPGEEYLIPMSLPGVASEISHRAFILSTAEANQRNGYSLLASSHLGARDPWAFWVLADHYEPAAGSGQTAFDISRPIGVEQMYAIDNAELPEPIGAISKETLEGTVSQRHFGAFSALRVQFAIPGYMRDLAKLYPNPRGFEEFSVNLSGRHHQFSVWKCLIHEAEGKCVIVANDKHNTEAEHIQALLIARPEPNEMTVQLQTSGVTDILDAGSEVTCRMRLFLKSGASKGDRLTNRLGSLTEQDRDATHALLRSLFGLS